MDAGDPLSLTKLLTLDSPFAPVLETARSTMNTALELANSPVRIHARTPALPPIVAAKPETKAKTETETQTRFKVSDLVSKHEIEEYVDTVLKTQGQAGGRVALPLGMEQAIYGTTVKVVLHILNWAVRQVNDVSFRGYSLSVRQVKAEGVKLKMSDCLIDEKLVTMVANQVCDKHSTIVSPTVDHAIYRQLSYIVFRLFADIVASFSLSSLGVRISMQMERDVFLKISDQELHLSRDKALIQSLAEDLLHDQDLKLGWLPDAMEQKLYMVAIPLSLQIIETWLAELSIQVFGSEVDLKIIQSA